MKWSLIVPGPQETISGGYNYDRRIVQARRLTGDTVEVIERRDFLPSNDDPIVIDGLALPDFVDRTAELADRKIIGLVHHPVSLETALPEAERTRLAAIEQRLFPALHRLIVTSETTAQTLATDFAVPQHKIMVVRPGTDDAPRSTGSGAKTCHILSIGSLIPRKGHDVLLRALARLFDLDWHLTIVGSPGRDPGHAAQLATLTEALKVTGRVTFAGEVTGPALATLWQQADLFALATHYEGYGMVVAEALRRGLPLAVTQGGAAAVLVPIEGGVTCAPGDVDGFSKAMRRLIFSAELRRSMGEVCWRAGQALPSWQDQGRLFGAAIEETRTLPEPSKGPTPF
jgi:glycosyltransferase involved in cell wall biosynthesis